MKKMLVLILIFVLLIGCALTAKQPLFNYKTGTAGLSVKFANNAPPNQVIETNLFQVAFLLENKGAYDITGNKGVIRVLTDENVELLQQNYDVFSLKGRSAQTPDGEQQVKAFNARARTLPKQTETVSSQISAIACYPYQTEAAADVCIDTDVYGQVEARKKACSTKSVALSGQGAPVAITKVDTQVIPISADFIRPQFTITISNMGKGEVIQADILDRLCQGTASAEEKSAAARIFIDDAVLGENPVDCLQKEVVLKDGKATFTCTTESPIPVSLETFLSQFFIKISYGYMETVGKSMEIKKSPFESQG